jgi:hypothetical protein
MTIRLAPGGPIELLDDCPVEDAETLLQHLLADAAASIDWSACDTAHCAVIQVLLLARRPVVGAPRNPLLREWVGPILAARRPD